MIGQKSGCWDPARSQDNGYVSRNGATREQDAPCPECTSRRFGELHQCMESRCLNQSLPSWSLQKESWFINYAICKEPYNHLVFLGLKGTGLLKKVFIGSEAVRVIEGIDNPIVAMPRNTVCCAREAIHVAVHKSYPLNVVDLSKFLNLAGSQVRKIVFFSVITQEDDYNATENYLRELVNLFSDKREDTSYELFVGRTAFEDLKRILSDKKDEFIVVQGIGCSWIRYSENSDQWTSYEGISVGYLAVALDGWRTLLQHSAFTQRPAAFQYLIRNKIHKI